MAGSVLQSTPLDLLARVRSGAPSLGCSSNARAGAVSFRRTSSGGFDKAFVNHGRVLRRPLSKSSSFGSSVDSPWHRGGDHAHSRSNLPECGSFSRAPQRVQAVQAVPANVEMLEAYEIERKVRDYELDHYGVVNNAIYAQFCQQARTELLENIGFRPDGVTETGKSMAISDMTMKFVSPLRSGDRYIVSSRVAGTTAVRLIFEDHIYKLPGRELIMTAKSTVVVLGQNSKPGRLPDEIKLKLVAGYSTNCQVKSTNAHAVDGNSKIGHCNGNSTSSEAVSGNSTSGSVDGNSTSAHVNGNVKSANGDCNGYSVKHAYLNGNSVIDYVKDNSTIDPISGHLNGNPSNGHVNGNSVN